MATITKAASVHTAISTGYTNPSNAYTDNTQVATAAPAKNNEISAYWGFPAFTTGDIPDTATVTSVTVGYRYYVNTTASVATSYHQAFINTTGQDSEQTDTAEPTTATTRTHTVTTVGLSDLRTQDVVRLRMRSARGNSNNAVTFNIEYAWLTVEYAIVTTITATLATASASGGTASINIQVLGSIGNTSATGLDATVTFGPYSISGTIGQASATGLDTSITRIITSVLTTANATGLTTSLNRSIASILETATAVSNTAFINRQYITELNPATASGLTGWVGISTKILPELGIATAETFEANITTIVISKVPITTEISKSAPDAIIDLFIADISDLYPEVERIYFFSGTNYNYTNIVWQGITYTAYPIAIEGFEWSGQGRLPTPKVRVANINGFITALNMQYNDLLGARIIRKRTFHKFLDAVNFEGGVNPSADPSAEFPEEVYFIDRKAEENKTYVEYELVSALDIAGVKIPKRLIIQNLCLWKYRGSECGYTGTNYFDEFGNVVYNQGSDVCGHRFSDCKKRFGNVPLNYGGFPGAGLNL